MDGDFFYPVAVNPYDRLSFFLGFLIEIQSSSAETDALSKLPEQRTNRHKINLSFLLEQIWFPDSQEMDEIPDQMKYSWPRKRPTPSSLELNRIGLP